MNCVRFEDGREPMNEVNVRVKEKKRRGFEKLIDQVSVYICWTWSKILYIRCSDHQNYAEMYYNSERTEKVKYSNSQIKDK